MDTPNRNWFFQFLVIMSIVLALVSGAWAIPPGAEDPDRTESWPRTEFFSLEIPLGAFLLGNNAPEPPIIEKPGTEVVFLVFPIPFGIRFFFDGSFSGFVADLAITGLTARRVSGIKAEISC